MVATAPVSLPEGATGRRLTPRQDRFVEEYLIDLNATQAAIRAGYSPKTANEQGARLRAKASIRAHIDAALAERSKRTGINEDRVIRELARIALANPLDVVNATNATVKPDASRDDTAAIQSVRVKVIPQKGDAPPIVEREVKLHDKIKALELLGKHLGMFIDRHEVTGKNGGLVEVYSRVRDLPDAELERLAKAADAAGWGGKAAGPPPG
jgi:phage terminase small subunit